LWWKMFAKRCVTLRKPFANGNFPLLVVLEIPG
jgi:hypothetical protein